MRLPWRKPAISSEEGKLLEKRISKAEIVLAEHNTALFEVLDRYEQHFLKVSKRISTRNAREEKKDTAESVACNFKLRCPSAPTLCVKCAGSQSIGGIENGV